MPFELLRYYSSLQPAVQPKAQGVQSNAQFPTNRKGSKYGAMNLEHQHEPGWKHMRTSFHKIQKIDSLRFAIVPVGDSISPFTGSNKGFSLMCDRKNSSKIRVDTSPRCSIFGPYFNQTRTILSYE
jgi:hypothetical protein